MKITAVVVTYNRKELLRECLDAILGQSRPVDALLVIDNASSDGTGALFAPEGEYCRAPVDYRRMEANLGGAGGFHEGMGLAMEGRPDWLWIMDDDSIPEPGALQALLDALPMVGEGSVSSGNGSFGNVSSGNVSFGNVSFGNVSFLASSVFGPEAEPMNVPAVSLRKHENGYADWYRYLHEGIVEIRDATFVSLLIRGEAVLALGLPLKEYFIWGDDTEYTRRLVRHYGPAYLCGKSRVLHKRFHAKNLSIVHEDNPQRLHLYAKLVRNAMITARLYEGRGGVLKQWLKYNREAWRSLTRPNCNHRGKKVRAIHRGFGDYFLGRYDKDAVRRRMETFRAPGANIAAKGEEASSESV